MYVCTLALYRPISSPSAAKLRTVRTLLSVSCATSDADANASCHVSHPHTQKAATVSSLLPLDDSGFHWDTLSAAKTDRHLHGLWLTSCHGDPPELRTWYCLEKARMKAEYMRVARMSAGTTANMTSESCQLVTNSSTVDRITCTSTSTHHNNGPSAEAAGHKRPGSTYTTWDA